MPVIVGGLVSLTGLAGNGPLRAGYKYVLVIWFVDRSLVHVHVAWRSVPFLDMKDIQGIHAMFLRTYFMMPSGCYPVSIGLRRCAEALLAGILQSGAWFCVCPACKCQVRFSLGCVG